MSLGLYLHIPYCFSKCRYCDFYSHPGERGVPDAYVDALLRELHRFAPDAPLRPDTVYFGGGTPSLLTPAQAGRLIQAAAPVPGAEITLEANPETVTEDSLRGFRVHAGDLLLTVPESRAQDGALMLVEYKGQRMVRKLLKMDGMRIQMQAFDREFDAVIAPAPEVRVLGRCVKLLRTL